MLTPREPGVRLIPILSRQTLCCGLSALAKRRAAFLPLPDEALGHDDDWINYALRADSSEADGPAHPELTPVAL